MKLYFNKNLWHWICGRKLVTRPKTETFVTFLKPFVNFAEFFVESNIHPPHPPHLSCTYEFVLEKSTQGCKKLGDASDSLS